MSEILVVADEERLTAVVERGLRVNGFTPTVRTDCETARACLSTRGFDLVILDLELTGACSEAVLRTTQAEHAATPVVLLSPHDTRRGTRVAVHASTDRVNKPFRFEELLARVRLHLPPFHEQSEPTVLRSAELRLDLRTRRVRTPAVTVELTAREFDLLELLLRHAGQALSREQILAHVWGYHFDPESNVVDVYVRGLRRKLGHGHIITVRGTGYRVDG